MRRLERDRDLSVSMHSAAPSMSLGSTLGQKVSASRNPPKSRPTKRSSRRSDSIPRVVGGWRGTGHRHGLLLLTFWVAITCAMPTAEAQTATAVPGTPSPIEAEAGQTDAPIPIKLPRDDAPHDAAIEWWYYTGHLFTEAGERYGFEFVVFKGHRGDVAGYAAHFAITDNPQGRFAYDQRLALAPATPIITSGFDLEVADWHVSGIGGDDQLSAAMDDYAIDLSLASQKPAVLHDGDGYLAYGSCGGSYYYSRTRLAVAGTLLVDSQRLPVTGQAWFDHQWGTFSTYRDGWDWYALQLDDKTELMLYIIHPPDGGPSIVDGSLVAADGSVTFLDRDDVIVIPTDTWTSPHSGVTYPSGWRVAVPAAQLALALSPALRDQELDTTASTDVLYWEGEVTVAGTHAGQPVAGLGYVELTGYANPYRPDTGT
jgi:predicted secreted hydrolase